MVESESYTRALPASLMVMLLVAGSLASVLLVAAPAAASSHPAIDAVVYRDLDHDGFLDAIDLQFTVAIQDSTVRPGDFVLLNSAERIVPFAMVTDPEPGQGITCGGTGIDDACFRLLFHPDPLLDSAAQTGLRVLYEGSTTSSLEGTLAGTSGQPAASFNLTGANPMMHDGAPPAVWSVYGQPGSSTVTVGFSEPVVDFSATADTFCLRESGSSFTPVSVVEGVDDTYVALDMGFTLTSAFFDSSPATLIARNCDTVTPGTLSDAAGNIYTAMPDGHSHDRTIAWSGTHVVSTTGQLGTNRVHMRFATGVGNLADGALAAEDFGIQKNSGTLDGIERVRHRAGSPWALILVQSSAHAGAVQPQDLQTSGGSEIRIHSDSIKAYGTHPTVGKVPAQKHKLTDNDDIDPIAKPRVQKITTVDQDRDGYLDALRIEFTEQIQDDVAGLGTPAGRGLWRVHDGLTRIDEQIVDSVITGGEGVNACKESQGTRMVPNVAHDNILFLCFKDGTVAFDGTCTVTAGSCLGTGIRPSVSYTTPTGAGPRIQDRSGSGNLMGSFSHYVAEDRAVPQVIDVCTNDRDGNGLIERLVVRFSEPMQDSRFFDDHWAIEAPYDDLGAFVNGLPNDDVVEITFSENSDLEQEGDTAVRPELTYVNPTADRDQQALDMHDNPLQSFGETGVFERDCAEPRLLRVEATVDDDPNPQQRAPDSARAFFSEPVRGIDSKAKAVALTVDHFQYINDGAGVSGITSVGHSIGGATGPASQEHTVVLNLNGDLDNNDIVRDAIAPGAPLGGSLEAVVVQSSYFFDRATGEPDVARHPLLYAPATVNDRRGYTEGSGDVSGPSAPGALTLAAGTNAATGVAISFPAVQDPSKITSYQVRYHTAPLTTSCFNDGAGQLFTQSSSIQTSGTQVIQVTGLSPETTYYFCVRAVDGAGNNGAVQTSGTESITTAAGQTDVDPPEGDVPSEAPVITWAGHTSGSPTTDLDPTFTWSPITVDDGSEVSYYWVLNRNEAYNIRGVASENHVLDTQASPSNVMIGTSYFHVAAATAAGTGPTATFELVLEALPSKTEAEITANNAALQRSVTAVKDGERVRVAWTVPVDMAEDLQGVQIWCGDATSAMLVDTIDKTLHTTIYNSRSGLVEPCDGGMYFVTGYYSDDAGKAAASSNEVPGFDSLDAAQVANDDPTFPAWLIWVAVIGGGLLILLVVLLAVLKSRKKPAAGATWQEEEPAQDGWADQPQSSSPSWDEAPEDEPYGADEDDDMPFAESAPPAAAAAAAAPEGEPEDDGATMHYVTCPECNDTFIAEGRKPLRIECPNCSAQGMLS